MNCVYCGVSYSYYNGPKHASRKSCRISDSGYHKFVYFWDWIWDSCKTCKT